MRMQILIAMVLLAPAAEARVGMDRQTKYESGAFLAGACEDKEHLKFLEAAYNSCNASEAQWDALYKAFKDGENHPEQCGDGAKDVLATLRGLASMAGGYECE